MKGYQWKIDTDKRFTNYNLDLLVYASINDTAITDDMSLVLYNTLNSHSEINGNWILDTQGGHYLPLSNYNKYSEVETFLGTVSTTPDDDTTSLDFSWFNYSNMKVL